MNAIAYVQSTKYNNMTGQRQPRHRAKPVCCGYCHLNCVSLGNVWYPEGHAPFVDPVRPEVALRMRWNPGPAWGIHGAVRGPHLEWHGFPRMLSMHQMTRERDAVASLERVTWNPVQDMI